MRLKRQIVLGFAIVVLLPLLSTLWTIRATRKVDEQVNRLNNFFPILSITNDIPLQVKAIQNKFVDVSLDPEEEGFIECVALATDLRESLEQLSGLSNDPEITRLQELAEEYQTISLKMIRNLIDDDSTTFTQDAKAVSSAAAALMAASNQYRHRINNNFSQDLALVSEISHDTRMFSWITSLIAFMAGAILAILFANYFSQQDKKLRQANDELAARYADLSRTNDLLEKQIEERERAEQKLRRSLSFEAALGQVSGLFATNHTPDLRQVTKALGEVIECDLTFIIIFDEQREYVEHQVEWVLPSAISYRPNVYELDIRPNGTWLEDLYQDGNVVLNSVSSKGYKDVPSDFWDRFNFCSMALVPITSKKKELKGYMGLGMFKDERQWSLECVRLLRVACEMLSNFLARQRAEERLKYDAFHDNLTGLPNRALFMDRLTHLIDRMERHPDEEFAVLFLDLDRFKPINDSMGHPVGDQLLIQVARELEGCVRHQDTVARLGGDEFTVLLEEITGVDEVKNVAKRILMRLEQPFHLGGYEVHTSSSIGVKLCNHTDIHADNVVRDADIAMYEAKNRGKSRYVIFHDSMHRQTARVVQMESHLRKAIERDEMRLTYQPILSFETGKIIGFEALLRWHHSERGMVSPAEFIPLAEETGLIVPIGRWVLEQACKQCKIWHKLGFDEICISVNVSAPQFYEKTLHEEINKILEETQLPAYSLNLELTEGLLMENVDLNISMLENLKKMGVHISVDDFGTGYSSLSYLKRFPLQTLKVDQSFVRDIPASSDDSAITSAIIALGQSLNLTLVAEGVENMEQYRFLKERGCDKFQGFMVSGPVPPETATGLLKEDFVLQT